jgi:hypothetical protein
MKPSEILRDVLAEQPDIRLAKGCYYDSVGCYCAVGLIAKARGVSDMEMFRVLDVVTEFFPHDGLFDAITRYNDEGVDTPVETLRGIIAILEEKGL